MLKHILALGVMSFALASPVTLHAKNTEIAAVVPKQVPQTPQTPQLQPPPAEALIIMIRSSLTALNQANQTNNYSVLNGLGSTSFRNANSTQRLSQLFAPFRSNNIDLSPVQFVAPQLSQQAQVSNGKLRVVGFFPTQPMRVDYDLTFEPENGFWRLQGISVNLMQAAAPPAPQPLPAPR